MSAIAWEMSPRRAGSRRLRGGGALAVVAGVIAVATVAVRTDTPPPASGLKTCLKSNYTSWEPGQCKYGTLIERTNTGFACNQALSSYGPLPIKVVIHSTTSWDGNAITLDNNCAGDASTDTVDIIGIVEGSGATGIGPGDDSFKFRQSPGPHDIQVTGVYECGPGVGHPDTVQTQGGLRLDAINFRSGDYNAGLSTCQGAGGAFFFTNATDVDVLGMKAVTCNHGLNGNVALVGAGNSVTDSKFRTGRTDGSDANCTGYSASPPCINTTGMTLTGVTCQQWISGSWQNVSPT